jgi:hypothetical protein
MFSLSHGLPAFLQIQFCPSRQIFGFKFEDSATPWKRRRSEFLSLSRSPALFLLIFS